MKVFLSHNFQDDPLAHDVGQNLREAGLEVWSADAIRIGDSLPAAISTAVGEADAFVLLIGAQSSESPWISLEAGAALASGKPVIPVLAEKGAEVPLILRDLRYLDLSDPERRQQGIATLARTITEGAPTPRPAEGLDFVSSASWELAAEKERSRAVEAARNQVLLRTQVLVAAVGVATGIVALGIVALSNTSALAVLASGLIGALLSAVAFLLQSRRSGSEGDRL